MRYTDRDCYAALIRVAAALNEQDSRPEVTWHVETPNVEKKAGIALASLAERLGVQIKGWRDPDQGRATRRLVLDHAPACYGGGVRAMYCIGSSTGQHTPTWWKPSAGLGPGAVPRKQFLHILGAVEGVLT